MRPTFSRKDGLKEDSAWKLWNRIFNAAVPFFVSPDKDWEIVR